ncbi:mitochondrial inner membrane translocase subunit TIM17, putative [Toxoplasma gondii ME49]|uniref:Mitochondrial import inner membrane translocase subunit, putative n=12 Tax=Toxoplasma gondii TaxID=5811 RepID=B9PZG4_TOXGV|nr:mitochondrial inner membrane translocase subunit TIM17, putative [Toxoplasma gondii ME49]EPR60150.1 putative mitochondrial inner membrane translocase subunit TIM17 [Toxoplasma gondii GT1]ESS31065.1 putative mitochondrial inner membrane translocase subunit TIM17 [Toxoplasma gondii VEG]KAF4640111.1 putative mitochondrial inner membrane translocase subunit TIM17 [Toxoplasma gondii]KFG35852.1 mitochondrial import inner membrane translocase subunit TIM17 protein [Toxoplasma gondii GAB2-2007-GAL-D|eukprot:XP_002370748.1 mitochondrial inner membrane translocase subunit TIM17, putative [Toxoplasma gondii ME49]
MASALDDDYLRTGGVHSNLSLLSSPVSPTSLSAPLYPSQSSFALSSQPAKIAGDLYLNGYGKQFGDKVTYSAGISYAAGLTLGGLYGFGAGLKRGGSTARLRLNAILNGCSDYAPKAGAQLGTITLFYCCFNNLLGLFREDEPTNAPIAGAAAGALYKSMASWKVLGAYSLTASLAFAGIDQYLRKYV